MSRFAYGCPPPRGRSTTKNSITKKYEIQACQSAGLFVLHNLSSLIKNVDVCHVFYKAIFMPFYRGKPVFNEDRKCLNACM